MTAQPLSPGQRRRAWAPDTERQRLANHTVEDVLALPDDAPRVELRDGVMIVVPSPTLDHQDIAGLLYIWLRRHAPKGMRASYAVGVAIDLDDTLEPDVVLTRGPVPGDRHFLSAQDVILTVEVVSPGTRRRDRLEKPADSASARSEPASPAVASKEVYAAAGIPFYWRIEQDPVHVYAYQLGPGETYRLVADSAVELILTEPFELKLPIEAITP